MDYLDNYQQLFDTDAFDYTIALHMSQEVMKAGGKNNPDFKHDFLPMKSGTMQSRMLQDMLQIRFKIC